MNTNTCDINDQSEQTALLRRCVLKKPELKQTVETGAAAK